MQGDFSRDTFDPKKHFSRVLMQQGRVQLDADWNELNAIVFHYLRTLARDVYGSYGEKDARSEKGFYIDHFETNASSGKGDFTISAGHLYVDGLLCENDAPLNYRSQADYPLPSDDTSLTGDLLVYLDVWERYVSALQDAGIREKALGGPDTAARAQILWQVRVWKASDSPGLPVNDDGFLDRYEWEDLIGKWQPANRGCLKVKVDTDTDPYQDPCIQAPNAGYRGAENHLYRIEVHTKGAAGTAGTATFKWSRENGSVVARWIGTDGNNLVVDTARGFAANQWVELIDDAKELRALPGTLVKVSHVEANLITIDPTTARGGDTAFAKFPLNPRVRRWDQQETEDITLSELDGAIKIVEQPDTDDAPWIALEDGIQVQFQTATSPHTYRTGDYWLVPARVATGDVEWPNENGKPRAVPPHGIHHVYAPLARIPGNSGTAITDWRQALA